MSTNEKKFNKKQESFVQKTSWITPFIYFSTYKILLGIEFCVLGAKKKIRRIILFEIWSIFLLYGDFGTKLCLWQTTESILFFLFRKFFIFFIHKVFYFIYYQKCYVSEKIVYIMVFMIGYFKTWNSNGVVRGGLGRTANQSFATFASESDHHHFILLIRSWFMR